MVPSEAGMLGPRGSQEVSMVREGLCWRRWGWGRSGGGVRSEQIRRVRPL